jgi:predicted nucleotidyltransferase
MPRLDLKLHKSVPLPLQGGAFLTGSYAYGTPRVDSDIDLVVMVSPAQGRALEEMSDTPREDGELDYDKEHALVLRFGQLNLICCLSQKWFDVWKAGTTELQKRAPVSREEACRLFKRLREEAADA